MESNPDQIQSAKEDHVMEDASTQGNIIIKK
jgi:hypothetical protein